LAGFSVFDIFEFFNLVDRSFQILPEARSETKEAV